ncbi:hypothetical protein J6590_043909 [Homalodisca vitripennis]|nr:hypothetical protein J6590_043909 [Homalodisca vitripennis]
MGVCVGCLGDNCALEHSTDNREKILVQGIREGVRFKRRLGDDERQEIYAVSCATHTTPITPEGVSGNQIIQIFRSQRYVEHSS